MKCLERESILCHENMIVLFKIKSSLSVFCVFLGIKIANVRLSDLKVLLLLTAKTTISLKYESEKNSKLRKSKLDAAQLQTPCGDS